MGYELTEYTRRSLNYRLSVDRVHDLDDDTSEAIRDEKGYTIRSSIGSSITYDRRDDLFDPRDGYYITLSNTFTGLGGDVYNLQNQLRAGYFYPVTDDVAIGLTGGVGYIFGLGDRVRVTDAFTLGGANLRGFETSGIGPRDADTDDSLGGQFVFDGTLQATFPVGLPEEFGIRGRAFTDFGTLTGTDLENSDVNIDDDASLRVSVGGGLTWVSPFGPIAVDLAYPILRESYDNREWFRFSVGTSF